MSATLTERLLVLDAWDEPHQGSDYEAGDWPEGSLHYEGRAATLTTSDGDLAKLDRLAGLATCASADYVEHRGRQGTTRCALFRSLHQLQLRLQLSWYLSLLLLQSAAAVA